MEPEGKHRNSIMKQRILAVFGLVDILVEYTLTMIGFQDLIAELEVWKLHRQTLKVNRGQNPFQNHSTNPNMVRILFRYDMLIPVPTVGLHHQTLKASMAKVHIKILLRTHTTKLRCSIMEY
ncbi:hypothetical protein EVAR_25826_1 [Eumeta japonica]|uniref:Uncharacterized protein n=1 Tax=Eumeta variegata TaxID=151549 RepID=A0A4C1VUK1_EUMVA|nr:hypothetical protein EVAR_25826_1 [Eumeta japonica]